MIIIIFLLAIIFTVLGFLFDAWILNRVAQKFKIAEVVYKKTLIISIIQRVIILIIALILAVLLAAINLKFLEYLLTVIIGFFIFQKVFNKYYKASIKDSLKVYVVYQIVSVVLFTVISLVIIMPTRYFIIQPFFVQGLAMSPTLNDNDYTFFKMFDKVYRRGDIIIHEDPKGSGNIFVKRIVGLPGEKIQIKGGKIYIYNSSALSGSGLDEPYLPKDVGTYSLDENVVSISDNQYYVLGDNRLKSKDSRSYGPINKNLIVGKYWFMGLKNRQ